MPCANLIRPVVHALCSVLLWFALTAPAQELIVLPDHPEGIYRAGQSVHWKVQLNGASAEKATFVVKKGGMVEVGKGEVQLTEGKGVIDATLDEPGWLLASVEVVSTNKTVKALGGALFAPEKIKPALPRPADFDAFWQQKLEELDNTAPAPKLETVDCGRENIEYSKIKLTNIRGSHIQGQLARPKQGEKFPAMLIVQWAGVYPLQKNWVLERAGEGWLVLNINAHDLPIDEPEAYYKQQSEGPLKDYSAIGNEDRETSYFLRMYLSCYRAADYLTKRADWDGRTLVVTGGSQGGLQSFVTAALCPKVSAVLAAVPAGCDLNGPRAERMPGWPMWYWNTKGKDEEKVRSASAYFDVVNFASRVSCPVLVGVGLIDTVCPAPGVYAACNQLKGPKEMVVLVRGEHGDKNGSHSPYYARFNAWKDVLVKGEPAPIH